MFGGSGLVENVIQEEGSKIALKTVTIYLNDIFERSLTLFIIILLSGAQPGLC